jgi:HEAT repeat protein
MNSLILIWQVACVLAGASLVWMLTLIVSRLIRTRRESIFQKRRDTITEAMSRILWDETGATVIDDKRLWKSQMVPEVFLGFVALVRGEERDRLIHRLIANDVDDQFRRLLHHRRKSVRFAAVEALAYFPGLSTAKSVDALIENTKAADIRIAGMRTLVSIGSYPLVPDVMAELSHPNASARRLQSVLSGLALHRLQDLLEYLQRSGITDTERAYLLESLGASADYSVLEILQTALQDEAPTIRAAALEGLADLAHPDAAPAIALCLRDSDWNVRAAAIRALRESAGYTYASEISALLSDPVWLVQFESAQALADMGPLGHNLLEFSARGLDERVSRTASLALAELGFAGDGP